MNRANVENVDAIVAQLRPALAADMAAVRESLRSHVKASALCAAEKNVLRLVGLGLTNRQIADHLCIGTNTVVTHLKHIYDKCGVKGERRLAVLAAGAGA